MCAATHIYLFIYNYKKVVLYPLLNLFKLGVFCVVHQESVT